MRNLIILLVLVFLLAPLSDVLARTSNDPHLNLQPYLEQIKAYGAWDKETGSSDVIVAVLDTGLDLDHPDLEDNIWVNLNEVAGDGIDNDQNGYVDDINGWDFVDDDGLPIPEREDAFGAEAVPHGSIIGGVIGAVGNNGQGVAGLNWRVRLMSVRILDNFGSGKSNNATKAIRYAVQNGAKVINLSFTGFEVDSSFEQAIQEAYDSGVVVVAAVGNQNGGGIDVDHTPIYPACFENGGEDLVLGVAAVNEFDRKADFSNYGASCTDISAPGENIYNTSYQDSNWANFSLYYQGGWNGTSIASPLVAGAAALLQAYKPGLSPGQIQVILKLSADPVRETGIASGKMGSGRLNIARALEVAAGFIPELNEENVEVAPGVGSEKSESNPSTNIVVAPESGLPPEVRVFSKSGEFQNSFFAYAENFTGGVRLALGDVDSDGVDEIITVAGKGGGPHVRVFELDGTLLSQFFAFDQGMQSGLYVSTGDLDGDGDEEIIVSEDEGSEGTVKVFLMAGDLKQTFWPYGKTTMSVRVALGDIDGDNKDEILTGIGAGEKPRVRVFESDGSYMHEFFAYAETYDKGIFVSAGDLDGDGRDEIVTGTDKGGGPHVRIFNQFGAVLGSFFAYDEGFRGGVRLSTGSLNGGAVSIITAAGPGGGPHVRVFDITGAVLGGFFTDEEADRNGINVAAWAL